MSLFGFGKSKPAPTASAGRYKLDKDVEGVINELRKTRVEKCQNMGLSMNKIGQDLAYIERRTREYYTTAVQQMKAGTPAGDMYQTLMNGASTEVDRDIINRMFSGK